MARRALTDAQLSVRQAVAALAPEPWLVACSGGPDSLALAWAAGSLARRRGTPCRALVVDHGLQEGSDVVAARVAETLAALPDPSSSSGVALRLDATVVRVDVAPGGGPEASARRARYAAFEEQARPGEQVLLGHTLDDQAETVLLGLARGSGTRSLAGMPAARGPLLRPLLGVGREVTHRCCADLGLTPWHDPQNADDRFARVRVRNRVLPLLERELGPGVREALARTAALAREDADVLDALAAAAAGEAGEPGAGDTGEGGALDATWLAGLAPAVRSRVLRGWLAGLGCVDVSAGHVAAVSDLVVAWRGQRGVDVPGTRIVRRDGWLRAQR
ncbi:tRNA lysidine(34) synthetase TilS [Nigerium massiliense]|uniref:tRNA lysidine(34) synthetase TilS n=1 Tax=Nigerium massiliense TaxID=1522317 RepID=UPI00058D15CA|nr:tRNA lysidine(34) synthetase TilS [Nigerium massiliense]